jgi:NTP pyrophosphatase (non-canonical NTP hydrolase)
LDRDERNKLYKKALDKWGAEAQILMIFEEMSELQQAVCKLQRKINGCGIDKVVDEIADTTIMIEQLTHILQIPDSVIETVKNKKLQRLKKMLKK